MENSQMKSFNVSLQLNSSEIVADNRQQSRRACWREKGNASSRSFHPEERVERLSAVRAFVSGLDSRPVT